MTDRYAVVGNPIGHSKSPWIHAAFARQTGEDLRYEALLAPLNGFVPTVREFFDAGGRGINVTVPFKEEAFRLAGALSVAAERAGAVNTLWQDDRGLIRGDNTDGIGLLRDITHNHGFPIGGARVLLLGAGGAARGVLGPLLDAGPASLVIANRTLAKAEQLRALFAEHQELNTASFDALAGQYDLIINGTSASLSDAALNLPAAVTMGSKSLAYDMVYGRQTPFLQWAAAQGARTSDGLGMLVEQAAAAFAIWRGVTPDTRPVLAQLREQLAQS